MLKLLADFGNTAFVDVLTELCEVSGAEPDEVCAGSIALEGPIIAQGIRGMTLGSKTSDLFCIEFLGLCSYPAVDAYTVPFPSPKPAGSRPSPSGQTPIQIVHYSDVHVDPFYVTGSASNCSYPICCRDYSSADAPGNNSSPAGPNGNHNCDAPKSLEASMYEAIAEIAPDAAFFLFTGDIVDHAVWNTTQPQNTIDINDAYSRMAALGKTVYGTAGNHEASPTNAFPTLKEGDSSEQWVYNVLSSDWTQWIGATAASETLNFGAYSVMYPNSNLRIISINTNFYYVDNYWMYEDPMETDPSGQFAWLVSELAAAETADQRVYIIGHTPMGSSDAFHDGSNYFDQIVNRYSNTIAALFFGHTHVDQFEIAYSDYSDRTYQNAVAMSYIIPSMTPTSGMPAFRIYSVDPVTFGVLDSVTYIADMTNPAFQTTGPVWTEYYSAKDVYGPLVNPPPTADSELSPAFWHNVTAAFQTNDTAFQEYYGRKSRGWNVASCTGTCQTNEICQLQAAQSQYNCHTPTPGLNFKKRDLGVMGPETHRDECGISVSRQTLQLVGRRRDLRKLLMKRASALQEGEIGL